jgi:SWI/SNF-related matrix-associated actin-dependent regulator of chromatin subfamily A member 5
MAPRSSRASGADTDTSMADASEPIRQLPVDPMVSIYILFLS